MQGNWMKLEYSWFHAWKLVRKKKLLSFPNSSEFLRNPSAQGTVWPFTQLRLLPSTEVQLNIGTWLWNLCWQVTRGQCVAVKQSMKLCQFLKSKIIMELFDGIDYDGPLICFFFLLQKKTAKKIKIKIVVERIPAISPVKFWSCRTSTFPITVDKTSCFHWNNKEKK